MALIVTLGLIFVGALVLFGTLPLTITFITHGKLIMWLLIALLVYYIWKR